jgi:serine protease Do
MKPFSCFLLILGVLWAGNLPGRAEPAKELKELKDREDKVKAIVTRVLPCVVSITSSDNDKPGSGSGVIVNKEGLILTAAHVTQATGNNLTIIFPDGRRVKGTSLGANRTTDAGMARITEPGEWPFVEMGNSDLLSLGDWVIAMGHPGGYSFERQPPVRLGRVWRRDLDGALFTSCPLIGGDSGGPLFDLDGRVVGIHSSIHGNVAMNRHVAIDTLRFDWDKLSKDQTWGKITFNTTNESRPITGAVFDRESRDGVKVKSVREDLPAAKAGLKPGDVVKKFDGSEVATWPAIQRLISRRQPGDIVPLAVQRGDELVDLKLELGRRSLPHRDAEGKEAEEDSHSREPYSQDPSGPRPYLGAALETCPEGAKIGNISPESPAAKAGLKTGDLIQEINGAKVANPTEAADALLALKPEDAVKLSIQRDGQSQTLEVKLGKK